MDNSDRSERKTPATVEGVGGHSMSWDPKDAAPLPLVVDFQGGGDQRTTPPTSILMDVDFLGGGDLSMPPYGPDDAAQRPPLAAELNGQMDTLMGEVDQLKALLDFDDPGQMGALAEKFEEIEASLNFDDPGQMDASTGKVDELEASLNFDDPAHVNALTGKVDELEASLEASLNFDDGSAAHSTITSALDAFPDEADVYFGGIRPYNVDSVLLAARAFQCYLFFFVYDSSSDKFVVVHNAPGCDGGCARIHRAADIVAYALRKKFPDRFRGVDDLILVMSTGDVPRIRQQCLLATNNYCGSIDFAPILSFGSVFGNNNFLPTLVAMPLPVRPHLPCFQEWQVTDGSRGVCQDLHPKKDLTAMDVRSGLVFGDQLGLADGEGNYWENLIPQVIWRGTDFVFLHAMFPDMRAPVYQRDIKPHEKELLRDGSPDDDRRWAIKTLWGMGKELLPRWRGVLLTSEAEIEAREHAEMIGEPKLPWANMKFSNVNVNGARVPAAESPDHQVLQRLGITAVGDFMSMVEQAKYRYHIDLGGGGGTTWTGTIEKLALPGVLFHHLTPTKDWFHDLLKPWVHYIPVKTDLSDLREKYEWAESHPVEARQIAEAGTQFVRWMGSPEGFAQLYEDHLVAPLRDVMQAYIPLPHKYAGRTALDVIIERGEKEGFRVLGKCTGLRQNSCEKLVSR